MNNFVIVFMLLAFCLCIFSVGFSCGRTYQSRKDFNVEQKYITREELMEYVEKEVHKKLAEKLRTVNKNDE